MVPLTTVFSHSHLHGGDTSEDIPFPRAQTQAVTQETLHIRLWVTAEWRTSVSLLLFLLVLDMCVLHPPGSPDLESIQDSILTQHKRQRGTRHARELSSPPRKVTVNDLQNYSLLKHSGENNLNSMIKVFYIFIVLGGIY